MKHGVIRTLSGRAIVAGAIVKIAVAAIGLAMPVPLALRVIDTLAWLPIAAGFAYFLARAMLIAKERLLWRLRRKLIISYVFIGLVPAFLIVGFFLLVGLILFSTFSSYLVQNRLQTLSDRTAAVAERLVLDLERPGQPEVATVLSAALAIEAPRFPNMSVALVPLERPCHRAAPVGGPAARPTGAPSASSFVLTTAGDWKHVQPPEVVPAWIGCEGFKGLLAYSVGAQSAPATTAAGGAGRDAPPVGLILRAVAFPAVSEPRYGVVADVVVDEAVQRELRNDTGVEIGQVRRVPGEDVGAVTGRAQPGEIAAAQANELTLPFSSASFLPYRDWTSGRTGTLLASLNLSIVEIYGRLSEAEGGSARPGASDPSGPARGLVLGRRSFGEGLLLVLVVIGALFLIIEVAAFVTGLVLARSITGSVHELFAGTERVQHGDFSYKIAIRVRDQLGELAASFNSMTASIGGLLREAAEKKRLEEELRIAHEIQMSLLPSGPFKVPGLSISAHCVPAREVGGDYYDILTIDRDRTGVLIADVSGKGTSAALYMAELKGLMLSLSRIHTSPRELLIEANRIIAEHLDARSFITMTYAVVDRREGTLTFARAGHTPFIQRSSIPGESGPRVRSVVPGGLVLGLKLDRGEMFERLLEEESTSLHDGDLFVFYTDGISEAMNMENECFGESRLECLIEEHGDLPSDQLRERVLGAIKTFVGQAPQHDDMTLILLRIGDAETPVRSERAETAVARA